MKKASPKWRQFGFGPDDEKPKSLLDLFDAPQSVVDLLNEKDTMTAAEKATWKKLGAWPVFSDKGAFMPKVREELRNWVDLWLESDADERGVLRPHTGKMLASLKRRDPARSKLLESPVQCRFLTTTGGGMTLLPEMSPDVSPSAVALNIFRQLVLHPECELVCGPCPHCNKYFLKKGKYRTKYCDDCDGSKLSAKRITLERQREELGNAIRLAREAVALYVKEPREQTWEAFTLEYLEKHGHIRTLSSLTRWVKNVDRPKKVAADEYLKLPLEIETLQTKTTKKGRAHA